MNIVLTELIVSQAKTVAVMFCAGVLVETMWQGKKYARSMLSSRVLKGGAEALFWTLTAAALPMFLYYCAYGKITMHAIIGFLAGLLLWKKMWCVIMKAND